MANKALAVKRIEALADCVGFLNDVGNPESDSYQLRNPGLCRAHSFKHFGNTDDKQRRIFTSFIGGYRFLVQDLTWKCNGETRAKGDNGKLKPTSSLAELLKSFNLSGLDKLMQGVTFLNLALNTEEITAETELKYFLENNDNGHD